MWRKVAFAVGLSFAVFGTTGTTAAAPDQTQMDKYVENNLKLVPLKLPEEDLVPDSEAVKALKRAFVVRVYFPDSKYGPGTVVVAIDPVKKRALFMAVSPSMIERGMKRTQVLDDGLKMSARN